MTPPEGLHAQLPGRPCKLPWPKDLSTLQQRFEALALRQPDHLAVDDGSLAFTYNEVDTRAKQIARQLQSAYAPEADNHASTVAVVLPSGSQAVVAILGVFFSRETLVVLDPDLDDDLLTQLLVDSESRYLLTNSMHLDRFVQPDVSGLDVLNIEIDDGASRPLSQSSNRPAGYLIYTSGSTGTPKAVVQDEINLLHWARSSHDLHAITLNDRIGLTFPINFGGAMKVLLMALLNGASLHPFDLRKQGLKSFQEWLERERISKFQATPTLLRQIYSQLEPGRQFKHLRLVYTGGETVHPDIIADFWRHFGEHTWLRTGGGASECLMIAECFIQSNYDVSRHGVPFGFIAPGYEVELLDPDGRPVPTGEPGEIQVVSRFLASGYWQRPNQTASKFVELQDCRRTYLTGDIGQLSDSGILFHKGRADRMVKVRGFRIELDGIEAELLQYSKVSQVAVILSDLAPDEIWAHLVPVESAGLDLQDLRAFLIKRLPEYMIPARMLVLSDIPLTSSEKVDRTRLPSLAGQRPELSIRFQNPRNGLETRLAGIWAQVLAVEPVGIEDSFIDLGGDSLKAMQIQNQIREQLNIDVPMIDLMDCPTVASLAERMTKRNDSNANI